jgi:homoserine O-acetyltransferase
VAETKTFVLPTFTFENGRTLEGVRIGYETFGKLNAAGDNAVLVPRSFSANSRVAGRVKPTDPAPGVWDGLIGPGKIFDTDRYFVVASANLAALPIGDPQTVTTGPASTDPKTGKPYGSTFPVYTIHDMVEIDHALLASLGVKKIDTIFGVSMGSMQGFEWIVAHPGFVKRFVGVLPMPQADGYLVAWMKNWSTPIVNDPNYAGGDYYGKAAPITGLVGALDVIHLHQRNRGFAAALGRTPADPAKDPAASIEASFKAAEAMTGASQARTKIFDANSVVYGARAMALFTPGGKATLEEAFAPVQAKVLLIPAKSDILFPPVYAEHAVDVLKGLGKSASLFEIEGIGGHYDGVFELKQAYPAMARFMSE